MTAIYKLLENPFLDSKTIEVIGNFTDNKPEKLGPHIQFIEGLNIYQYIVDGKLMYCNNKQSFTNDYNETFNIVYIKNGECELDWLYKSINIGDPDAFYAEAIRQKALGADDIYYHYMSLLADAGSLIAIQDLREYFRTRNDTKYEYYSAMAFEMGDKDALYYLAHHYFHKPADFDTELRYNYIRKWALIAAERHNYNGLLLLGKCCEKYTKNYEEMKKWYNMAHKNGCLQSMLHLAAYYADIEHNYDEMERHYLLVPDEMKDHAYMSLATYYQTINVEKSRDYYLLAAERKYAGAYIALGKYYQFIEKNYISAKYWYKLYYFDYIKHKSNTFKIIGIDYTDELKEASYYLGAIYKLLGNNKNAVKYLKFALQCGCMNSHKLMHQINLESINDADILCIV